MSDIEPMNLEQLEYIENTAEFVRKLFGEPVCLCDRDVGNICEGCCVTQFFIDLHKLVKLNGPQTLRDLAAAREQRDKLLWSCLKALNAYDLAAAGGKSNWSGADVDEMRAAVLMSERSDKQ